MKVNRLSPISYESLPSEKPVAEERERGNLVLHCKVVGSVRTLLAMPAGSQKIPQPCQPVVE